MKCTTWISKTKLLLIAVLVVLFSSCSKDDPAADPKMGESFEGGIVFYLDGTGKHGLAAAPNDQSINTPWFNGSFVATNAMSLTDGSANTTAIINAQGSTGSYAAKLCRDFRGGGKTDWFLPSKDQLNLLYAKKTLVGGFSNNIYWSSSEYDIGNAWVQHFLDGLQHLDNTSDGATVGTRAIRAF